MNTITLSQSVSMYVIVIILFISIVTGQKQRSYKVSFDIEVLGCHSTDTSQNVVTFEKNRAFLRQIYVNHKIAVNEAHQSQHLSYNVLPVDPIPSSWGLIRFQFKWFPSQSYTLGQETCCWSVNNVAIANPYTGNSVRKVRICYDQQTYKYKGKTWVCPVELVGQITSDVVHFNAENGAYLGNGIYRKCTNANVPVDLSKWNECSNNASIYFDTYSPLFIKISNEIIESPVDGIKSLSAKIEILTNAEIMLLLCITLNPSLDASSDAFQEVSFNVIEHLSARMSDSLNTTSEAVKLLQILDNFALKHVEPNGKLLTNNFFFLKVQVVNGSQNTTVNGIQVGDNFISLPSEIFVVPIVRVASFFFPNLSHVLPPLDTNNSIVSPVISSAIDCTSCPVTDLTENVTVQLTIYQENYSDELDLNCVFFDFRIGDWNTSGCTTEVNGDLVTCSCNHLTHFAILLSPGGPEISAIHYDVLNTIGLVLIPISLLCMVLVILIYTLIRSLWSIRNYVHIMLCVSLFMAQLAFILGVDKIENQSACSAVAVILLYLFLVTFMWMLMEGVVLYVTLIRVLITNHKYYIIAFTAASYVIPAVYMAFIAPVGYLVNIDNIPDHTHFLYYREEDGTSYLTACWLNYSTGFIWSFIAPVIVIIMINIGFFIMAVVIAKRHSTKSLNMGVEIRHWILVAVSLTTVLGLGWVVGVLAFRRELLSIVYITTVYIAAQGIILFIILVPLSKQVRNAIHKTWTKKKKELKIQLSIYVDSSTQSTKSNKLTSSTGTDTLQSGSGDTLESSMKKDLIGKNDFKMPAAKKL